MENVSNVSSEEELLQLRNEGKISEEEYQELRDAMQKTTNVNDGTAIPKTDKAKAKRKLGIITFALMLAGIILPCLVYAVCWLLIEPPSRIDEDTIILLCVFLLAIFEIAALGTGIAAWPDPFGKASVTVSSLILVGILLSIGFTMPRVVPVSNETAQLTRLMTTNAIELKRFPLDEMDGIIAQSGVQLDREISSDGNGSLRIDALKPTTIRLFETGDIDIENARLIYQARVRTENVEGQVYLEMWCHFAGTGDFFSKGLMTPLSGTTDWTTEETPFFLKAGENPDNVKLNLVINGKGTVWIDDIRLLKGPLKL